MPRSSRLPDNCEPSAFMPGVYVVYDGKGYVWHARRAASKLWRATPAPSNPARQLGKTVQAESLTALSASLRAIIARQPIRPDLMLDPAPGPA